MDKVMEKWNEILQMVKEEHGLTDVSFNTWIKPLEVFAIDGNTLYILVPSEQMGLSYINKKYYLPLKVAIGEVTGIEYDIQFILPDQAQSLKFKNNDTPQLEPQTPVKGDHSNLNPNYTFDTFVVGNNNRFAHSASLAVAESPGEAYNPLYIYGGPGLGKTHLMHSIGHFIIDQNPDTKVLYVTSEEFTNEVIESIRNGNSSAMTKFRDKYRTVDVLMIDDIQFIIGKESTQEEFFHTFNTLQTQGKQIILTSDKPPKEMETLEERIRSRFEWGLMADIGTPDYETRMAILRKKVIEENIAIDDSILDYIASNIISNIRELQGAINKVISFSNLCGKEVTMELAKEALSDMINPNMKRQITIDYITETVADHFGITVKDLMSTKRNSNIAFPRHICMYLCRQLTSSPLAEIGNKLGNRHHSTILHGIEIIEKKLNDPDNNEDLIKTLDVLNKKIDPQ